MKRVLVIGNVWPEPNSSAAGIRMLQLLDIFISQKYHITFACTASESLHKEPLEQKGIAIQQILINDSSFDLFITDLQPNMVIFDRFMTEEQFGWRVIKNCPDAIRILNTEDLHCLRHTREVALKRKTNFTFDQLLLQDITKREIASIYRSDISLIISSVEMDLLKNLFKIPKELLLYIPFLFDPITLKTIQDYPNFENRKHFITIGNFRHNPNWDSIRYLHSEIWPIIRKKLPNAEMHIYGAYPPPKANQLHSPKNGFLIKGWTKDAKKVMKNARICLAPLRFGAGIKGKLAESMLCGTPNITTAIGSEGMIDDPKLWNGSIQETPDLLAHKAIHLYQNKKDWEQAQQKGVEIINSRFDKNRFHKTIVTVIEKITTNLTVHRTNNFIGSVLQFHTLRSTEFMSRWIEEKNKGIKEN